MKAAAEDKNEKNELCCASALHQRQEYKETGRKARNKRRDFGFARVKKVRIFLPFCLYVVSNFPFFNENGVTIKTKVFRTVTVLILLNSRVPRVIDHRVGERKKDRKSGVGETKKRRFRRALCGGPPRGVAACCLTATGNRLDFTNPIVKFEI